MENASKALIMAGGILIALLIIGSLVLMFTSLQDYRNSEEQSTKDTQVAKFNDQFEPYKKDDLTLMELKSVYNKIESNNKKYPEYEIEFRIEIEKKVQKNNLQFIYAKEENDGTLSDIENYSINNDLKTLEDEIKINTKFKCKSVAYDNDNGRISKMIFEQTKFSAK